MTDIDNKSVKDIEIGIIGSGSMGKGMTLLFAEKGSKVGCYDYDKAAVERLMKDAKNEDGVDENAVHGFSSIENLVGAFPEAQNDGSKDGKKPRIVILSLPHGKPVDGIMDDLLPLLSEGDVVIDGGNEHYNDTARRQKVAAEKGIEWVGCGVSGGYQAARHGPSMSPGCSVKAWEIIKPVCEKWAAKTKDGDPCVMRMGPGGSGHYVKMIHNGIEHAQMSVLCEVRGLLAHQLGISNDRIAALFETWHKSGPLRGNYLVGIGFKALRFKKGDGIEDERGIVEGIEDKVTQDADYSEGSGTWSSGETSLRHVAAPSFNASHDLRIISANRDERLEVIKNLSIPQPSEATKLSTLGEREMAELMEDIHRATYGCFLAAFVMGLELIAKASKQEKWDVALANCMKIWRAGCIIQSDAISEFLLPLLSPLGPSEPQNPLRSIPEIGKELSEAYRPIKKVYGIAFETDSVSPAVGATLEWLKAVGGKHLPTDFEEMELDYFGHHNYDVKGENKPGHKKGTHHTDFSYLIEKGSRTGEQ